MTQSRNADHVRAHTPPDVMAKIDTETANRVRFFAPLNDAEITRRIDELEYEWDIERYLELFASTAAMTGVLLSIAHSKKWLFLSAIALPFLLQHASQGWSPPLSLFRRLGVRTRREIDQERYALKALRGDFDGVSTRYQTDEILRAGRALQAVRS